MRVAYEILNYRITVDFFENYCNTIIKFLYNYRHRSIFYLKMYITITIMGTKIPNTDHFLFKSPKYRPKNWQIPNTAISYAPHYAYQKNMYQFDDLWALLVLTEMPNIIAYLKGLYFPVKKTFKLIR